VVGFSIDLSPSARHERLGFGRAEGLAEELVDRQQVDRQRVDGAIGDGLDAVHVGHELHVAVHEFPGALDVGVEDVGTVDVDHDPGFRIAFRMAVARHVGAGLEHLDLVARLGELVGNHGSRESRADDGDIFFHLFYPNC
jgi:hypothetical protein